MSNTHTLAQISQQIKALEKRTIQNVIAIGKLLHEASEKCEHGEWLPWLKAEFGWSYMTAKRYRDVFDLQQIHQIGEFDQLNISISALYLVAEHIGDEDLWVKDGCKAIIEAARQGRVTYRMAYGIFEKHKDDAWTMTPAKPDPAIEPDDDDDTTSSPFPSGRLAATVKGMLQISEHDPSWSDIIDFIGADQLFRIITMLQIVYDDYTKTTATSAVKAIADRAEQRSRVVVGTQQ